MDELISEGFVFKIMYIEENDALIYALLESGNIVKLKAKGFQKPESKNRTTSFETVCPCDVRTNV